MNCDSSSIVSAIRRKKMADGGMVEKMEDILKSPMGDEDVDSEMDQYLPKEKEEAKMSRGGMISNIMAKRKSYSVGGLVDNQNEDLSDEEMNEDAIDRMPADPAHEIEGAGEEETKMRRRGLLAKILSDVASR